MGIIAALCVVGTVRAVVKKAPVLHYRDSHVPFTEILDGWPYVWRIRHDHGGGRFACAL